MGEKPWDTIQLTRSDVERALKAIIPTLDEINSGKRQARDYQVLWNGFRFPPKVVVSKAMELKTGKPFPGPDRRFFGGWGAGRANSILDGLGFKIVPKIDAGIGRKLTKGSFMARKPLMLPVVSHGAEYLVMGYLMRRNILIYKAPPHNEGYDLICIHPNPRRSGDKIRVQVKSRYQTDSNRAVFVSKDSLNAFDYLIAVFLNIGYFYGGMGQRGGRKEVEFYTLPRAFVRKHYVSVESGMDRILLSKLDVSQYKNEQGFELIARDLRIPYPRRRGSARNLK